MTTTQQTTAARAASRRKVPGRLAAAAVALLGLSIATTDAAAQGRQTQETVIRLAGSGTIGSRMALELATGFAKQMKLPGVRIDGGLDPDEYDVVAEGAESASRLRVQVRAKGSTAGLEPMLRGQADIWMSSRQVRDSDIEGARRRNVPNVPSLAQMQQPGVENVVGLAALAVVVHPRNPVQSLTPTQIKDIFLGRITSWAQVGGPSNMPIGLYSTEASFGAVDAFCSTIIGQADSQRCVDSFARLAAPRFTSIEDLSDAVAANPAGISFVDLALRRSTRPVSIGTECGTGIEPSTFRIKTDEYPLGRRLFFYTAPGRQPTQATRDFVQFALSASGQALVAASGMADLAPGKADQNYAADRLDGARETMDGGRTRARAPDVRSFEGAVAGADRLSITFRFQTGTHNLDSRAEVDIARLAALMQTPAYNGSSVMLVGFSSTPGDYAENRNLSRERAEAVRDRLTALGVQNVSAVGVGPIAAVSCNLDPVTGPLNQRVEVWIRKGRSS